MKTTYYVNVGARQISKVHDSYIHSFQIQATDEEITHLRQYFNHMDEADSDSFYRAQTPYLEYHFDQPNDDYDEGIKNVYKMIYHLGDEEAKQSIRDMKIFDF